MKIATYRVGTAPTKNTLDHNPMSLRFGNTLLIISCWLTHNNPEPPNLFKYKFLQLFSLALDDIMP